MFMPAYLGPTVFPLNQSVIRETVVLFIAYQLTFLFEFAVNLVSLVFDLIQVN